MIDKDRVAIVTGATGSLGSVVARSLAEQGARLALFSTNPERLEKLASCLSLPEGRLLTGPLDFTAPEAAQAAAGMVLQKFGRADILLHLVGGWTGGIAVTDVPAGEVPACSTNIFGPLFTWRRRSCRIWWQTGGGA